MLDDMTDYFEGEKNAGRTGMALGIGSLIGGTYLLATGDDRPRGVAISVMTIGLAQLIVGSTIFFRTDGQLATLTKQLRADPSAYFAEELARMEGVNFGFSIYKWIELALLGGGAGLGVWGAKQDKPLVEGIGIGIAMQATLTLLFDIVAEKRAHDYVEHLRALSPVVSTVRHDGADVAVFGVLATF